MVFLRDVRSGTFERLHHCPAAAVIDGDAD